MPKTAVVKPKKVAAKKVVAKKVAPKKVVAKTEVKPVVYADNSKAFWVADGRVLDSLIALKEALAEMEKAVFTHHVTPQKNDFSDWVDLVLGDAECAMDLRKVKTPKMAHTVVAKRLKIYQA